MPKLMDALVDAAELLDWSVHINDDCIEFEKYSPAGEDFFFTITGNDEARVVEQVRGYAYLTNELPKPTLRRALRKEIGLTEQEIKKYQMEWVLEDHYDGEAEV